MSAKKIESADASSAEPEKKILSPDFKILETFVKVAHSAQLPPSRQSTQNDPTFGFDAHRAARGISAHPPPRTAIVGWSHLHPRVRNFSSMHERLIGVRDEMIDTLRDPSTVRGIVRLGVSETIVHTWLPTLNPEFEIAVDISPRPRDGLVTRDLNLAFLPGPIDAPNVYTRQLCSFPVAFVAHEQIGLPHKWIAPEHIAERTIITFARHTLPQMALRELLARSGRRATVWASASSEAVTQMALDGLGVAVVPPAIIEKKAEARAKLRRLNTTIKLPNLDDVASWPTAPDDTADTMVRKVVAIATRVAREWPR
jgi:DNA-binding transcriptional LysR family regulator